MYLCPNCKQPTISFWRVATSFSGTTVCKNCGVTVKRQMHPWQFLIVLPYLGFAVYSHFAGSPGLWHELPWLVLSFVLGGIVYSRLLVLKVHTQQGVQA